MPADFKPAPSNDPEAVAVSEERNQARLRGWWDLLGEEPDYPVSTNKAVELLRCVEYEASADVLLEYANEGVIPPVPRDSKGRLAWHATNLVTAAAALEARRKWIAFSNLHGHKLTMIEKIMQISEHRGECAFTDLAQYDLEGLLGLLHQVAGDRGATEILTEAVRRKLQLKGIL